MTDRRGPTAPTTTTGWVRRGAVVAVLATLLLPAACGSGDDSDGTRSGASSEQDRMQEMEAAFLRRYEAEGGPLDEETTASSVFATAQDWCRWRSHPDVPEEQFFGEVDLGPEASGPLKVAAEARVCDAL